MRTWIELNKKNIKQNHGTFRRLIGPSCLLMAVVKSNAYGHNLTDFSIEAEKIGVDWLGVDSLVEAETLRKAGIKKPILVLGYTAQENFFSAADNNISLTVSDFTTLQNLGKLKDLPIKIHLKIDTGMHRQGFFVSDLPEVLKIIKRKNSNLLLEGVYTHFASAKNPTSLKKTAEQINEFNKALEIIKSTNFHKLIKHVSATAGTILSSENHFDMVRVGIGMYGLWPSEELENAFSQKISLYPVLSWKTIVTQIKTVPKGERIGYDLTEKLARKTKTAILPIGYWHGFPRVLSSIGEVTIKEKKAKVLGRVSMDMISVDVTDIKNIKNGEKATIIDNKKLAKVTAKSMANLANTTPYEILTRLNPKIKRFIY